MIKPLDLISDRFQKYFIHFEEFRQNQLEIILKIVSAFRRGKKFVLVQAPTGSSKTFIAVMVAAMLELRMVYICLSKQLQSQFISDFPDAVELLGRNNYVCQKHPSLFPILSAELCTASSPHCQTCELQSNKCKPDRDGKCGCVTQCAYGIRKRLAMNSDAAVLNAAYGIREFNFVGGFSGIPLLVCDEFEMIEQALMGAVELSFSDAFIKQYSLPYPPHTSDIISWKEWAPSCLEEINRQLSQVSYGYGIGDMHKQNQLEQKRSQLEFLIKDVDRDWVVDGMVLRPIHVNLYGEKYLWRHADRVLGLSATLTPWIQLCSDLGIDASLVEFIELPSTFEPARRPIYYRPAANMSRDTKDDEFPKLVAELDRILEKRPDEKGLVHCVSYENVEKIIGLTHYKDRMLTHTGVDRQAKLDLFKVSDLPLVMLTPSMERGVDLPDSECRFIVIAKCPFPSLANPQVRARLHSGKSAGQTWYSATTARRIVQATGRGMRSPEDYCVSYILDSAFGDFYQRNNALFPKWWRDGLILEGGDE